MPSRFSCLDMYCLICTCWVGMIPATDSPNMYCGGQIRMSPNDVITTDIIMARKISMIIGRRHPQRRSPMGSGSDMSAMISPMSGVNIMLSRNVQPNPILRLLPTSPTRTLSSEPVRIPKMIAAILIAMFSESYIGLYFIQSITSGQAS